MKWLMLCVVIVVGIVICGFNPYEKSVGQRDVESILSGIAMVESSNRDLGVHPDGVSYGKYGVTYMAVTELKRVKLLPEQMVIDLCDPIQNELCATKYFILLVSRFGGYDEALKHWNYNDKQYSDKVYIKMLEINTRRKLCDMK